jgi:hypothetical protein
MTGNCNKFYYVKSGDGCWDIANSNGVSLDDFYAWNPAVGTGCASLWPDFYVCVGIIGGSTTTKPTTPTTPTTPPTPTNGITTPTPTQSGMVNNCNKFYFVQPGEGCYQICDKYKISIDQFYAWNPAAAPDCRFLYAQTYCCVGVIGGNKLLITSTPQPTMGRREIGVPTATQV